MKVKGALQSESYMKFVEYLEAVQGNAVFLSNVYSQNVFHLNCRIIGRVEAENGDTKDLGATPKTRIVKLAVINLKRNNNRIYESKLRFQREATIVPFDCEGYRHNASQIAVHKNYIVSSESD
jgi:hypothetical protein